MIADRELATMAYWAVLANLRAAPVGSAEQDGCIALLCTMGAACPFERLRIAAARSATAAMPAARWGVSP